MLDVPPKTQVERLLPIARPRFEYNEFSFTWKQCRFAIAVVLVIAGMVLYLSYFLAKTIVFNSKANKYMDVYKK